jgi:flagellar biosynthesis/type III secretory pathway ATPase
LLPRILERAGRGQAGSITGFYTILVEGDDMNEPVSDTVRSILDGHLILSRRLATQSHYPAIDLTQSISRLMNDIVDEGHQKMARELVRLLAVYGEVEDLVNIGAYAAGANPEVDLAVAMHGEIQKFLRQGMDEGVLLAQAQTELAELSARIERQRKQVESKRNTRPPVAAPGARA